MKANEEKKTTREDVDFLNRQCEELNDELLDQVYGGQDQLHNSQLSPRIVEVD